MLTILSKLILKRPFLFMAIILAFTLFFFNRAFLSEKKLRVDFSLEQMFPESDPEKDVYQSFIDDFNREDDKILLVYESGNPASPENISILAEISEMIELDVDGVESVVSLATIDDGDYFSDELTEIEREEKIRKLLLHPIYSNLIISKDGRVASILIDLEDDILSQDARALVVDDLEQIMNTVDWTWHEAGIPILRTRYIQLMNEERAIFLPISFLVAIAVLYFIFRQLKSIIVPMIAISTTLIWIAGIMSFLNITINVVSYLTFNLLMIIGASNAIHLLMKYHEGLGLGLSKKESLERVIEKIGGALFLTSFTTSVGFCSLGLTNIKITQQFGLLVGFGVILMFVLTLIIMPIILNYISLPDAKHIKRLKKGGKLLLAERLNSWNNNNPRLIVLCSSFIFLLAIIGLNKINYNASVLEDLKPGNKLYDDLQYVEQRMGGTLPLEIIIDTKIENGSLAPDHLKKIQVYKGKVLDIKEINSAISPGDYLMLINESIGNGFRELPISMNEALSYSIDFEPIQSLLSEDYSKTRISCRMSDVPYDRGMLIRDQLYSLGKDIFDEKVGMNVTGSTLLALSTGRHLVNNLTTSFFIAFIIIFLSIVFLFRSFSLSMIAVLPNIIPLMIAGGLMGYFGIKLRPSTAMTFSIALGIAVDNTIHFLARFREEFKNSRDYEYSVSQSLITTGKAIISTGIILSLGFFVLYFSEFVPNHEFGFLATMIIVTAVLGSLILLPVLILYVKPKINFK
tara:strand:- start:4181 stop:6415 length:2235 start_codon:yes stop_codon:yes gene_type:complete